jgi:hypothetical protein
MHCKSTIRLCFDVSLHGFFCHHGEGHKWCFGCCLQQLDVAFCWYRLSMVEQCEELINLNGSQNKSKKKLFDVRWIQSWLEARPVVVERASMSWTCYEEDFLTFERGIRECRPDLLNTNCRKKSPIPCAFSPFQKAKFLRLKSPKIKFYSRLWSFPRNEFCLLQFFDFYLWKKFKPEAKVNW